MSHFKFFTVCFALIIIAASNCGAFQKLCNLSVTVDGCVVAPSVVHEDNCQGKITRMIFEYIGAGCNATNHNQDEGKVLCGGDSAFADPVFIVVSDKKGDHIYAAESNVPLNGTIIVDPQNADRDTLGTETIVSIYNASDQLIEESLFHTSCSQPLSVGDQFGSARLIAMATTEGGEAKISQENPQCLTEIPPSATPPHCEGKVRKLQLRYTAGGCAQTNHTQDQSKVECFNTDIWQNNCAIADLDENGGVDLLDLDVLAQHRLATDCNGNNPVRIVAFDGKDYDHIWLDTGQANVYPDDIVELDALGGGRNEFTSVTTVQIFDEYDELIEEVTFHTSCSQPLNLGDQFGSLEVFGMETTNGGTNSLGVDVIYTYTITNNGPITVENVTVTDDYFGQVPGSPIEFINPGETVTLTLTALLSEQTTNTVTVVGRIADDFICEATATTTITKQEEPLSPVACTTKIRAMLLQYTGPTILNATVEFSPKNKKFKNKKLKNKKFKNKKFENVSVVYRNIDLIPGVILASPAENDMTIDALAHDARDLGSKVTISINGIPQVIHTSCSAPFEAMAPAPLDNPKGDPSTNWFVIDFEQKQ